MLTSYNGSGILEYDSQGYPQKWFKHGANNSSLDYTLQWGNANNLVMVEDVGTRDIYTYMYNDQGIRTFKFVNDVMHTYYLQGEQIIAEKYGNRFIKFYYDGTGICGFNFNGTDYYYQKNIQGDILKIYDGNGNLYAEYGYDAWGKCTIKTNVSGIAAINPFRYRGYYLDDETGLYYLNARYYDPEIGRFISPDSIDYLDPESINGLNIYIYCGNNPVMNIDPSGHFAFILLFAAAFIGFGLSFSISVLTQAAFNNGHVNWLNALIDGLFGAISGALAMIPGLGPVATGVINVGLTLLNGIITTSIDRGGISKLTTGDWIGIVSAAALAGIISGAARNSFFKAGGKGMLTDAHTSAISNMNYLSRAYSLSPKLGANVFKHVKLNVVSTINNLNFGKGYWRDWLISGLSAIFSNSFSKGLNYAMQ